MKIKIYLNISIYSQTLFKYMNGQLMETIIFKYFLKILKIKINYDFVFDFSKKFTRNAFALSHYIDVFFFIIIIFAGRSLSSKNDKKSR